MSFDPTTAQIVHDFDPSTATVISDSPVTPQQPTNHIGPTSPANLQGGNPLQVAANSQPVATLNSIGGGVATGLADTVTYGLTGQPSNLPVPEHVQEAMTQNPMTTAISKGVGSITGAVGITAMVASGLGPAISTAMGAETIAGLNAGVITSLAANTIAGSLVAGPHNRLFGAATGLISASAGEMVGMAGSKVSAVTTVQTQTKEAVGKISSQIKGDAGTIAAQDQANMWNQSYANSNQMFEAFRSGSNRASTLSGKIEANPIIVTAAKMLSEYGDELTPAQQKALTTLVNNSATAKNIADLHDARKLFNFDYSKFTEGRPLSGPANEAFHSLSDTITSVMENNAESLGVGEAFKTANKYYKSVIMPMINTGAKDTAEALSSHGMQTDPMTGAKIIDTMLNKFINVNKPEEAKVWLNTLSSVGKQAAEIRAVNNALTKATGANGTLDILIFKENVNNINQAMPSLFSTETKQVVTGLNKVIDEATTIAGMSFDVAKLNPMTKVGTPLIAGVTVGAAASGSVLGGGVGLITSYSLLKLANSKIGQQLLIKASSPGGRIVAKSIVNGILLQGVLKYGDNYMSSPHAN